MTDTGTTYNDMTGEELKRLAGERNVTGRSSMNREALVAALEESDRNDTNDSDPWGVGAGTDPNDQKAPADASTEGDPDLAAAQAALDPTHLDTFERPLSQDTQPQIAVKSPEGSVFHVPANLQEQYEGMNFEVLVGAEEFGPNGTRTAQADENWVEFGKLERKQAEARLGRGR